MKLCKNAFLWSIVSFLAVTNPEDRDSNPGHSTSIEWQMKLCKKRSFVQSFPLPLLRTPRTEIQTQDTPRRLSDKWSCVRMRSFVQSFPLSLLQTPRTEIQTQDTPRRLSDKWSCGRMRFLCSVVSSPAVHGPFLAVSSSYTNDFLRLCDWHLIRQPSGWREEKCIADVDIIWSWLRKAFLRTCDRDSCSVNSTVFAGFAVVKLCGHNINYR